jgi:putative transcriptional regulator
VKKTKPLKNWVKQLQQVQKSQDSKAFAELFDYFAPRVKSFLIRSGASNSMAEDCAQEVMATVWLKAHLFDPSRASVSTWIFTIARNKNIDALRKQRRPEPEDLTWGPESEPEAADILTLQQETEQLRLAMSALPDAQQALLQKAYFGDLSHREIAIETGLPLGTIKSRLRLALDKLRQNMRYSAGALPEAFNLIVATHLEMCDKCRAAAQAFDSVGGVLLDETAKVSMSKDALPKTLALISKVPKRKDSEQKTEIPNPLAAYVGSSLDNIKWRPIGMGVRQAVLKTSKSATARLLYIPAGSVVPDHGHRGTELTLVLKGAFSDETAKFTVGDIEMADQSIEHTPTAEIGEDCICLTATDAPLRFNSWFPRLVQRFLRI